MLVHCMMEKARNSRNLFNLKARAKVWLVMVVSKMRLRLSTMLRPNMDNYIHYIGYMEQARKSGVAIIRAQLGSMRWSNFLKSLSSCFPELVSHPDTQHKQCTPPRSSGKQPVLLDRTLP